MLSDKEMIEYIEMNNEDKMVVLNQRKEKHLRRISNNVAFFFWLTILGIVVSIIVVIATNN